MDVSRKGMFNADGDYSGESPPWEVLYLVAGYMDDKTIAIASCVSKTWNLSFSSDQLWRSLCATRHPYLSAVKTASPAISYTRLYSIAESAARHRHLVKREPKPKISLSDLTFVAHVWGTNVNTTAVKHGKDIMVPPGGPFWFSVDVNHHDGSSGDTTEAKVTWNVVFRESESVFTMVDCVTELPMITLFSQDLPAPEYCLFSSGSGLAAVVKIQLNHDWIKRMGLGILNRVDSRYLNVDEALRYLERFLLPQGRE
ncbi:PREDICTED: probable F-box protein At5g04010 [Tarenaya hassleriana]|uniref:probable F-box protein At5g04010 n=1 Tax=Tarenaya hassleriana TaxID=28532 RepID=UPI00053C4BC1|nr:PREDICTED: probable F-box protein At5g04010 [Tarenaya hassleriana]